MRILKMFLLFMLTIMPLYTSANLRAPYNKTFENGGQIYSSVKLKVLSAKLYFDFEKYYSGDLNNVMTGKNSHCKVEAIYKVSSEKKLSADFDFISPSRENFTVKVNNQIASIRVKSKIEQKNRVRFGKLKRKYYIYSVKFNSSLKKGINVIHVTYLQPISVYEASYGYFRSSSWSSSVEYQYWPIKEWEKDKNFFSEISVSVPYHWGIFDYINGADINILLKGFNKKRDKNIKFIASEYKRKDNRLIRIFTLKEQLPDIINAEISEN
jgi:hypothetical protein